MWTGVSGHKTKPFHQQARLLPALASEPFDVCLLSHKYDTPKSKWRDVADKKKAGEIRPALPS